MTPPSVITAGYYLRVIPRVPRPQVPADARSAIETIVLALPLGLAVGSVMGLLGAGGALLTVPAMVYLLDQSIEAASTASLLVVAASAAVGAGVNVRRGACHLRLAAGFAAAGVGGALLGSWLSRLASGPTVLLLLSILMLGAAAALWRGRPPEVANRPRVRAPLVVAAGFGVGVLTGFCGVGGGFIILPVLVLLLGLPVRAAVGTSLLIIAVTALAGAAGRLGAGGISWPITLAFGAAALAGAWLGARTGHRLPTPRLSQGFAVLLVGLALVLMAENAGAIGI
jgi:uncharacterized protein